MMFTIGIAWPGSRPRPNPGYAVEVNSVLALALLAPSAAWYVDDACVEVAELVYSAKIDAAEARIAEMSRSKDLDANACALWIAPMMKEMQLALDDDTDHLWNAMHADLDALEKFGQAHRDELRFSDLIIEAEFRRVRVFAAQEERIAAVKAVRRAQALLDERRRVHKMSPTYLYAEALINLAITHADWHVRAACALLGMSGDGPRGKKAMGILVSKRSVYQSEAMVVARSFTQRVPGLFDAPLEYSTKLRAKHPSNPQLAFDHATDLGALGRCKEAIETLADAMQSVSSFSRHMRAKLARARQGCD